MNVSSSSSQKWEPDIRWERAGVRVSPSQNPKLFLHETFECFPFRKGADLTCYAIGGRVAALQHADFKTLPPFTVAAAHSFNAAC